MTRTLHEILQQSPYAPERQLSNAFVVYSAELELAQNAEKLSELERSLAAYQSQRSRVECDRSVYATQPPDQEMAWALLTIGMITSAFVIGIGLGAVYGLYSLLPK